MSNDSGDKDRPLQRVIRLLSTSESSNFFTSIGGLFAVGAAVVVVLGGLFGFVVRSGGGDPGPAITEAPPESPSTTPTTTLRSEPSTTPSSSKESSTTTAAPVAGPQAILSPDSPCLPYTIAPSILSQSGTLGEADDGCLVALDEFTFQPQDLEYAYEFTEGQRISFAFDSSPYISSLLITDADGAVIYEASGRATLRTDTFVAPRDELYKFSTNNDGHTALYRFSLKVFDITNPSVKTVSISPAAYDCTGVVLPVAIPAWGSVGSSSDRCPQVSAMLTIPYQVTESRYMLEAGEEVAVSLDSRPWVFRTTVASPDGQIILDTSGRRVTMLSESFVAPIGGEYIFSVAVEAPTNIQYDYQLIVRSVG